MTLFQASQLASSSSKQLDLSVSHLHLNWCKSVSPQFLLLIYMKTEEPIESRHFQGLPQVREFFTSWV